MKEMIWQKLRRYSSTGTLPMHMPGHKRNERDFDWLRELGAALDITEIDGFDNLNDAKGILLHSEERAAALWGAKRSFYLVNGSTGGILASVRAGLLHGGEALVARNCHKSVYHALELCGNPVHFLLPEWDEDFGIFGSVLPQMVEAGLQKYPQVRLVILTSPTYEGVCSDLVSIAEICHAHGVALLVDAAHGAHLGLKMAVMPEKESFRFPVGAVEAGADLTVQSLHKTLPSLTQTAILHWNSELIPAEELARQVALFQSSSPSYLLMASMDGCVDYLEKQGAAARKRWQEALRTFREVVGELAVLRVLGCGTDSTERHPFFDFDPSKLVISVRGSGYTGGELMRLLRERHRIELEMSSADYVLAMTGMGDTPETLARLAAALLEIDGDLAAERNSLAEGKGNPEDKKQMLAELSRYCVPEIRYPVSQAVIHEKGSIPLSAAAGAVSAEYIWAYPPGIPLIIPGEVFDEPLLRYISWLQAQGVELYSTWGGLPEYVFVCK